MRQPLFHDDATIHLGKYEKGISNVTLFITELYIEILLIEKKKETDIKYQSKLDVFVRLLFHRIWPLKIKILKYISKFRMDLPLLCKGT